MAKSGWLGIELDDPRVEDQATAVLDVGVQRVEHAEVRSPVVVGEDHEIPVRRLEVGHEAAEVGLVVGGVRQAEALERLVDVRFGGRVDRVVGVDEDRHVGRGIGRGPAVGLGMGDRGAAAVDGQSHRRLDVLAEGAAALARVGVDDRRGRAAVALLGLPDERRRAVVAEIQDRRGRIGAEVEPSTSTVVGSTVGTGALSWTLRRRLDPSAIGTVFVADT